MAYFGHPDFDAPEFHLSSDPAPWPACTRRRLSREELRRLQEQLDAIDRAQRAKES